jgi:hypothetical protein
MLINVGDPCQCMDFKNLTKEKNLELSMHVFLIQVEILQFTFTMYHAYKLK